MRNISRSKEMRILSIYASTALKKICLTAEEIKRAADAGKQ